MLLLATKLHLQLLFLLLNLLIVGTSEDDCLCGLLAHLGATQTLHIQLGEEIVFVDLLVIGLVKRRLGDTEDVLRFLSIVYCNLRPDRLIIFIEIILSPCALKIDATLFSIAKKGNETAIMLK